MDIILFLSLFTLFTFIYLTIGWIASQHITTMNDYFLANRSLGVTKVTFTLIATQLGGALLLGTSQEAYEKGLYGILLTIGMVLGFLLLGCGLAPRLRSLNVVTTAELFETKYHSSTLKKIASTLSITTMSGLLISQIVGSKLLLNNIAFMNEFLFIIFWCSIIFYTVIGGFNAVVLTDIFQVLLIITTFGGIFLYSIYHDPLSLTDLITAQKNFNTPFSMRNMLAPILMPALFSLIEQDLAQRFFAARTKRIAFLSAFGSSIIILLFSFIPIYFGMKARLLALDIPLGYSPLLPVLKTMVNDFFLALALCSIIAAITSTADSLLCAISSNLAQDFDFSFFGESPLKHAQYITAFIGIICLIFSYLMPPNMIIIILNSLELSVSCLLIPLLFCYFAQQVKKSAAIGSMIGGLIGFIVFRIWIPNFARELITLLLSLIGYGIGNFIKVNSPTTMKNENIR
ncbi:MAG: sodium:solute symporter family protein [Candidatus Babeliales bacterium]